MRCPDPEVIVGELAMRRMLPDRRYAVFLGGSVVRGWGNARSDLDVYVVGDEPWTGKGAYPVSTSLLAGRVRVHPILVGERRWEVEYWDVAQTDALLEAVSWENLERGVRAKLTKAETAFVRRMALGAAVEGTDWITNRVRQFDASAVRCVCAMGWLDQYDNEIEDVLGMLDAGDEASATLAARNVWSSAVEALLASRGEIEPQSKWRARRVKAVADQRLPFEAYWALETLSGYDQEAPFPWIESVLKESRRLVEAIEL